ncbi:MAG: uncharacterized protein JWM10_1230 [Myxococcaceae bacterium]|nr:uncharacterized protein [Myxococcaceae bacterium]
MPAPTAPARRRPVAPRGRYSRAASETTAGVELLFGRPEALDAKLPHEALFGGEGFTHYDGEHEWGWRSLPDGRYVFGWVEGEAFRASQLKSRDPNIYAARRADGKAFLASGDGTKVWEVSAATGKAALVFKGRDVFGLAYFGAERVWVCSIEFVDVFRRTRGGFVREAQTYWGLNQLVSTCDDRVLVAVGRIPYLAYAIGSTAAGPVLLDRFALEASDARAWRGGAVFAGEGESYAVTHLDALLAAADRAKAPTRPFVFPHRGPFSKRLAAAVEDNTEEFDETGDSAEPSWHACRAEPGHVGLDYLGTDPPDRDDEIIAAAPGVALFADENLTENRGALAWGWQPEGRGRFRFCWVERGALRASDLVARAAGSVHAARYDGRAFLAAAGKGNRELWAIDRATATGTRVCDAGAPIEHVAWLAHGRVLCATAARCVVLVDDGGWRVEQAGRLAVNGVAVGARGRVVALDVGASLLVWASTKRGLVRVDELDVPVLVVFEIGDGISVCASTDGYFAVTNLEAAAVAAERARTPEAYPPVALAE